jgi:predicted acylesterase/phospholipase RssA
MSANVTEENDEASPIVLCLSGGGFRATFFHLGVIRLLAITGWLKKVTHVFSVSGGSILAGHMALNWESYSNLVDAEFHPLTSRLIEFGQTDVRGRILRRWVPFIIGRTKLFERYLNSLYKDATLSQLPDTPKFHFLSTSLTSGQLCSFSKEQWTAISAVPGIPNFASVKSDYLKLSRVVAASASFPPFFPPVRIRATGLDLPKAASFQATHYLTDGVYLIILESQRSITS